LEVNFFFLFLGEEGEGGAGQFDTSSSSSIMFQAF